MGPVTGQIETVERARSGKSWRVKINGQWFSCKEDSIQQMIGQVITFTPEYSEYRGKSYAWLNDWTNGTTGAAPPVPPAPPVPQGQQNSSAPPRQQVDPHACLPMTSNLVAHAIAAGAITSPEDIRPWAQAAFNTAMSLLSDEPDDDIPF